MRKAMACLALILTILPALAGASDDYNEALKSARKGDKHPILFFYSTSCPYCDLMEKETLTERQTASLIRETAILVRVDGDRNKGLARLYGVRAYPTIWLLEPSGGRITQLPGYVSRPDFHIVLSYLKGRHYRHSDLAGYAGKQGR